MTSFSDMGSVSLSLGGVLGLSLFAAQVISAQECGHLGGWSLRFPSSSCPQDAPFECGKAQGLQVRCCPSGYSCAGNGSYEGNYCCQGSTDVECADSSYEHPKCPEPSWSLWGANDTVDNSPDTGAWCCKPGFKGIYRDNGTAAYLCTSTTVSALQPSYYWANALATASCSVTATPSALSSRTEAGLASSTASPDASSSSSTGTTSPDGQQTGGITSGAIAGAVIGGVAAVALIIGGIFFMLKRRKKKTKPATGVAPVVATEKNWHGGKRRRPSELETVEPRLELSGVKPTYELAATQEHATEDGLSPADGRLG
ncbi:hypothetical protein Cob_v003015 [Colletotrichum orbiculare MAFF 240422]|uniref:Uncharacterized protein n=1 Tax=Colletotrichum orbiculare (strain 104-T / ATCC 96160 / CBS 514.97 / LARS 414 / MAFF 240422) TaxID=1213857 RepID=A0A484G401_COLOR|nr:hypothetical protein Cob_v003015 [Colletotrichum orbiculare MAFF 240422]